MHAVVPTSIVVEGVPTELVGTGYKLCCGYCHKACGNGIQKEILPPSDQSKVSSELSKEVGTKPKEPRHGLLVYDHP